MVLRHVPSFQTQFRLPAYQSISLPSKSSFRMSLQRSFHGCIMCIFQLNLTFDNCAIIRTVISFSFLKDFLYDLFVISNIRNSFPWNQLKINLKGSIGGNSSFISNLWPAILSKCICRKLLSVPQRSKATTLKEADKLYPNAINTLTLWLHGQENFLSFFHCFNSLGQSRTEITCQVITVLDMIQRWMP